jgi:uncharacterized membrane protein (UPF0127 family)
MKSRNKIIIPIVACVVIVFAIAVFAVYVFKINAVSVSVNYGLEKRTITVGSTKIPVEVAATASEQQQGLSDRPSLPADAGMIFPMSPPSQPPFWMPRMHFPLDFIYLNGGRVVELKENVSNTDLTPFAPNEPVDAVLEVNAGFVANHGINVGDAGDY